MEHPVSTSPEDLSGVLSDLLWSVVIPIKQLKRAKTRLDLNFGTKQTNHISSQLALAFASDVIDAAVACPAVENVYVVTGDAVVAKLARENHATVIEEPDVPIDGLSPLNSAIAQAAVELKDRPGASRAVAVITGDLPCLTPHALEQVLTEAGVHRRSFVPDHTGSGTAILCDLNIAETSLDPRFGIESATSHRESGAISIGDLAPPQARLDVDTSDDLRTARGLGVGVKTAMVLESLDSSTITE